MSIASLFGGLALANAALGAAHGFAGPLGGMLHAPHGVLCPRLSAAGDGDKYQSPGIAPARATQHWIVMWRLLEILTGDQDASVYAGVKWTYELVNDLHIPRLSDYGMTPQDFPAAVQKTQKASSFKGNPILLSEAELTGILEKAL